MSVSFFTSTLSRRFWWTWHYIATSLSLVHVLIVQRGHVFGLLSALKVLSASADDAGVWRDKQQSDQCFNLAEFQWCSPRGRCLASRQKSLMPRPHGSCLGIPLAGLGLTKTASASTSLPRSRLGWYGMGKATWNPYFGYGLAYWNPWWVI